MTRRIGETLLIPAGIFLGAVLLFALEPMIARMILPWFGGSAEVWTSCLLFFQTVLCAGYAYAHASIRWLTPRQQRLLHAGLLVASAAFLPIMPDSGWQPQGSEDPLLRVLGLLSATIGLPFLLLSASSPLLQAWLVQAREAIGVRQPLPYRLFALSNAGSLLSLLAYPVLAEPLLPVSAQAGLWSHAYLVFIGLVAVLAILTQPQAVATMLPPTATQEAVAMEAGAPASPMLWLALAAAPSMLLLAITSHITQNVAAMPLLWVMPLALYLLSLILCFEGERWYRRPLWLIAFAEMFLGMAYAAMRNRANTEPLVLLALFSAGLFTACMCCHGELAALRPKGRQLTLFYLVVALGGAIGGILVGAVAPAVFDALYDMPIALAATAIVVIIAVRRNRPPVSGPQRLVLRGAVLLWAFACVYLAWAEYDELHGDVVLARNFYGALRVTDIDNGTLRRFMHGTIIHGEAFRDPARACEPTTYYGRASGVGLALASLQRRGPIKVGLVGLGAGTLAAYARPQDDFRFYEIDPQDVAIARQRFDFLDRCGGPPPDIILGDGRLSLEREPPQGFDMLVLDAFSGDAIPAHLLTREAFQLYWRQVKPGGVIAVHISNQFVDLAPVVASIARDQAKTSRLLVNEPDPAHAVFPARWVLVSAQPDFLAQPSLQAGQQIAVPADFRAWTDDYSDLWRSLR